MKVALLILAALAALSLAAIWVVLHEMSDREPLPVVDGDFGEAGW